MDRAGPSTSGIAPRGTDRLRPRSGCAYPAAMAAPPFSVAIVGTGNRGELFAGIIARHPERGRVVAAGRPQACSPENCTSVVTRKSFSAEA